MSKDNKSPANPTMAIVVTAIICATIVVITVLGFSYAYEQLNRTTDRGGAENSPVDAVLKAQLTNIATFFVGAIGAAFGGFKLYQKVAKVEKQTNGRSHTRDAERDLTVRVLEGLAAKAGVDVSSEISNLLTAPTTSNTPPEDEFTTEEREMQRQMMELSRRMTEARAQRQNNS